MSYLCTTINLYTFSKFWLFLAKKGKIEGTFRQFELQSTGKFSFLRLLLTDNPAHCIALFAYYYYSMRISKWTPPIRGLVAWCGMFLAQSLQRIPTTMPGVRSRNWIHTKGLDKKEREREVLSSKKRELFRHKRNNYLFHRASFLIKMCTIKDYRQWRASGAVAAYQLWNASSRTITEVKQHWDQLLLGWETVPSIVWLLLSTWRHMRWPSN